MKLIHNGSVNSVLLSHDGIDATGSQEAEFTQLGRTTSISIPLSIDFIDCYAVSYLLTLSENILPNATYLIKIKDGYGDTLFSFTSIVDGNTDEQMAYVVLSD